MVTLNAILFYGVGGKLANNSEPKIWARSGGYSRLSRAVAHRFWWAPVRTRINIRRIEWSIREVLENSKSNDLAGARSDFMVGFFVGFSIFGFVEFGREFRHSDRANCKRYAHPAEAGLETSDRHRSAPKTEAQTQRATAKIDWTCWYVALVFAASGWGRERIRCSWNRWAYGDGVEIV